MSVEDPLHRYLHCVIDLSQMLTSTDLFHHCDLNTALTDYTEFVVHQNIKIWPPSYPFF